MIVWGTRNGSRPIAIETGWTVQYQSSSDYTATVQQACIQELNRMHGGQSSGAWAYLSPYRHNLNSVGVPDVSLSTMNSRVNNGAFVGRIGVHHDICTTSSASSPLIIRSSNHQTQ